MAVAYGFDVLEVYPNRADVNTDQIVQAVRTFDPGIGKVYSRLLANTPTPVREFAWWIDSKQDADDLRTFLAARKGRAVPFWLPTWQEDMVITADVPAASTSFTITFIGFAKFYAATAGRCYLAIYPSGTTASPIYRKVTAAVDNGNGTETLTIDSAPGVIIPASTAFVSFLTLCRMAEDTTEIAWESSLHGSAALKFQEIPNEAP